MVKKKIICSSFLFSILNHPLQEQLKFWLTKIVKAPDMGLEPMTLRLKVWCSTDWANRAIIIYLPEKLCV